AVPELGDGEVVLVVDQGTAVGGGGVDRHEITSDACDEQVDAGDSVVGEALGAAVIAAEEHASGEILLAEVAGGLEIAAHQRDSANREIGRALNLSEWRRPSQPRDESRPV